MLEKTTEILASVGQMISLTNIPPSSTCLYQFRSESRMDASAAHEGALDRCMRFYDIVLELEFRF